MTTGGADFEDQKFPCFIRLVAIATVLVAIATRLVAIATGLVAIATGLVTS